MDYTISTEKMHQQKQTPEYIRDPEEALDLLEILRLESGKFLYEYPARFRRVFEVIRRK